MTEYITPRLLMVATTPVKIHIQQQLYIIQRTGGYYHHYIIKRQQQLAVS